MQIYDKNIKKSYYIFLISIFIIFYFSFLFFYYQILSINGIVPSPHQFPILLIIGFTIIIVILYIAFLKRNDKNELILEYKIINEYYIKISILSLMLIVYLIPPILFSESVIAWSEINILNYFRAIIFIIGCAYIPGSILYKIIVPKNNLHEKFKIQPFLIKMTIYPLLSFSFLGFCTLILDFIGLKREYFSIILFLIIIILSFLEIILLKTIFVEKEKKERKIIRISNYSIFILLLALGIIFITLGIRLSSQYLVEGDAWRGIQYAYFVGDPRFEPFWAPGSYSKYWGYISFSLSCLSGIPYLNINAMLFPFVYLYIISIYLMVKVFLYNFKEKYSVISTIFITTYSGLFYILNFNIPIPNLVSNGIILFDYKGISFIYFFISLAIFISILKTTINYSENFFFMNKEFPLIFLSAFFLLQSYLIYFLPVIPALLFILIFTIFSSNSIQIFKYFRTFLATFIILFIFFDILTCGFISYFTMNQIFTFFEIPLFQELKFNQYFFYSILLISFILLNILYFIIKKINLQNKHFKNFRITPKIQSRIVIFLFTSLILTIIIFIVIEFYVLLNNHCFSLFIYYIHLVFQYIGYVGILGLILSYFCYKKYRKDFYILLIWTFSIIGLASILFFLNMLKYPTASYLDLPDSDYYTMVYWFNRLWAYSIIPLSIFFSIGIIKIIENIKSKKRVNLNIRKINIVSILIFLTFSNMILSSMYAYNLWYKESKVHEEVQVIGWVSENIQDGNNILIEDPKLNNRLRDMTFCNVFDLDNEVNEVNITGEKLSEHLILKEIFYYICENDPYELVNKIYNYKLYEYGNLRLYSANFSEL